MNDLSFTTFLKICLLNTTAAKAGAIQRMHEGAGGYDFYKRLKLAAQAVAEGKADPSEVLGELSNIKRKAERDHNMLVAKEYVSWWQGLDGAMVSGPPPKGQFKLPWMAFGIRLLPELRYKRLEVERVTYLWATALPKLTPQVAGVGLQILRNGLADKLPAKAQFEIRDLRRKKTYTESVVSNNTDAIVQADLALVNSLWVTIEPKAA